jgi:type I restriction enzyme M protein
MVDIVDPKKNETVLDPACGTAGFLIASYLHVLESNKKDFPGDLLTPEENKNLNTNFIGYDISPEVIRLAMTNLFLHGFPDPHLHEYDTLTSIDRWYDYFNVILANPPFMSPTGGIQPHKRFTVQAKRSEVLFVDYIAEHLTPNGRAAIIVPEGIIFQSGNAYKQLRKMLIEQNYLWAVVSLPNGVFNPYAGVKTSILFLDKKLAKKTDQILFIRIENDGFSLGANRTPIEKNDLPEANNIMKNWQKYLMSENSHEMRIKLIDKYSKIASAVSISELASDNTFNLSANRYKTITLKPRKEWQIANLVDLCIDIKSGFSYGNFQNEGIPHLRPMNITNNGKLSLEDVKYIPFSNKRYFLDYLLEKGDILFNNTNSKELVGKAAYIENNLELFFSNHMTRIRTNNNKVNPNYLSYILHSLWQKRVFYDLCNKWVGQAAINLNTLSNIQIPLPPMDVQREIVDEIESYQRIIDGARQVVENWKPNLEHELELARKEAGVKDWEYKKLGNLAINLDKLRKPVTKSQRMHGKYPYYGASGIVDYVDDFIFEGSYLLISEDGANLLARSTPIAFSVCGKIWVNNHAHVLDCKDAIIQKFVELYINSIDISLFVTGAAQPKLNQASLNSLRIPQPPYNTQKIIVEKLNSEQNAIESNRKLIEIYEEKIRQVIARVWEG